MTDYTNPAVALIAPSLDTGDWTSYRSAQMDCAEALHFRNLPVPAEWHFRPSPIMTEATGRDGSLILADLLDALDAGSITSGDVREAFDWLETFTASTED